MLWRLGSRICGAPVLLGAVAAATLSIATLAALPASAQTSTPEIVEKERSDPAAGEVVIINPRKSKSAAPDPYAPIARQPLPAVGAAKKSAPENETAGAAPIPPAPTPAPPRTGLANTDQARDRLQQFPQAPLTAARETGESDQSDRQSDGEPESDRRAAVGRDNHEREVRRQEDDRRQRRLARRDHNQSGRYQRADPEVQYRRPFGERPWQLCRQLAWRCENGFDRACNRWQRNCT